MKKSHSLLLVGTLIAPMMLSTGNAYAKSAEDNPPAETLVRIHAVTDMNETPMIAGINTITGETVAFKI